jgi:DNA-binding MarR family transcriptional regulator
METLYFKNRISDFRRIVGEYLDLDFKPIVEAYGLTLIQYRVLYELEKSSLSVGQISKIIGLAKTNTSTLCKKMEKEGYIKRRRDLKDERIVTLELLPAGREIVDSVKVELQTKYGEYFNSIPQEDIHDMRVGIQKIEKVLKDISELRTK